MANPQKSSLQAWLEYIDTQTGSPRRVDISQNTLTIGRTGGELRLTDPQCSEIHAILTREAGSFVLRDLGSKKGTLVNDRPIVEISLNNLDKILIGSTLLTFRAAYLAEPAAPTPVPQPAAKPTDPAAPGHHAAPRGAMVIPFAMFTHPIRFWRNALNTGVTQIGRSWITHLLALAVLAVEGYANGRGIPAVHTGFLVLAATLGLGLIAMTCSVFFAFDSLPDAPHRLTQSLRFTFHLAPFLLAAQTAFLIWAAHVHPQLSRYFLASIVPTSVVWALGTIQARHAFGASVSRAFAFAVTASVPWNLFMTGLMSFVV